MLTLKKLKRDGFEIFIQGRETRVKIEVILEKVSVIGLKINDFPYQIFDEKGKIIMRGWDWETFKVKRRFYVIRHLGKAPSDISIHNSLRFIFALELPWLGGFLLHSSSAVYRESAVCFSGKSGAGKTTILKISRQLKGLDDDMNVVLYDREVLLYPFPYRYGVIKGFPLKYIFLLRKGKNYVREVPYEVAMTEILSCMPFVHTSTSLLKKSMEVLENILEKIKVYELYFLTNGGWEEKILTLFENQ